MSYPRELEDYSDNELTNELQRRINNRRKGCCDYCGRPIRNAFGIASTVCKYPDRHRIYSWDEDGSPL